MTAPIENSATTETNTQSSKTRRRKLSTLTIIILAVNMIPLMLMGFGLFYIDKYNQKLIQMAYLSLERQGSMLSYMIQKNPDIIEDDIELATRDTLVLMIDENGYLKDQIGSEEILLNSLNENTLLESTQHIRGFRETLASFVIYLNPLETELPHFPGIENNNYLETFPEIKEAVTTRQTVFFAWATENSFILTAAIPLSNVNNIDQQPQVLFLMADGKEIVTAIDLVRLDIVQAFITVLIITFLLSVYLSSFIAIPLKRLANAVEEIRRGKREIIDIPDMSKRNDEIGELSLILRQMTAALHNRMDSIERFAADVAHEIKNPLTSLRSAIETSEVVTDPKDQKRLFQMVKGDILRLDQLITDISQTSRLDSELARDMFQKVDLKALLAELVNLWRSPMDRIQTEEQASGEITDTQSTDLLQVQFTSRPCLIMGKSDSLAQAFQNIISNAISFNNSEKGPVLIKVMREPQEKLIQIMVEDHGPGMSEAVLEKIFNRFYTDRPDKKKSQKNSGLGLSIAKQIIEAHSGTVRAENIYDHHRNILGARFIINLYTIS